MNATRIVSRDSVTSAGSSVGCTARPSGMGWIHLLSGRRGPASESPDDDDTRSIGSARRCRPWIMSRHTLVAMRYSQDRSADRPSKRSKPRQARTIVSWTASSASNDEPSIR